MRGEETRNFYFQMIFILWENWLDNVGKKTKEYRVDVTGIDD